ncbi:MAG: mechanosensitive ion channel [Gammaproteobacteria bacterium]|nr:mechanosensitive ion channel [Gammaproteobacteria bacterium]MCK5262422.1 mechanosensitive ion channel [Gammaproteobacteria bacterium]
MMDVYVIPWTINITMAIIIFVVGKFAIGVVTSLVRKLMSKAKLDNILVDFISSIIKTILLLFVVIASLNQLGVDTTSLIALIGAAGLAIGLSLQSTLQNLAAGVMLIIFRPFKGGDFIDAGGVMGTVEKINIFNTVMRTGDNREIIVPNGSIYGGTITNYSARETRRVDMVFGIGYNDDLRKAKDIIKGILDADERVLSDPEPLVAVAELADSSVNFNVRPWCKSGDYWDIYYDTHENIKLTFEEAGISIPYPQMDVHMDKVN